MNTHVAPLPPCLRGPPTIAVRPSADRATEEPCHALPTVPVPTNPFCRVQTPPLRPNTATVPAPSCNGGSPTRAMLPSADRATEGPKREPTSLTSFAPCWDQPDWAAGIKPRRSVIVRVHRAADDGGIAIAGECDG